MCVAEGYRKETKEIGRNEMDEKGSRRQDRKERRSNVSPEAEYLLCPTANRRKRKKKSFFFFFFFFLLVVVVSW